MASWYMLLFVWVVVAQICCAPLYSIAPALLMIATCIGDKHD